MSKKEENFIVICSRDGEVVFENGEFNKCKHITIEETKDFYKYLKNIYGKTNKTSKKKGGKQTKSKRTRTNQPQKKSSNA